MEQKTIVVAQEKGGAAKTTTAVNLATLFARDGYSVLFIDIDPSAHATKLFTGCDHKSEFNGRGIYDVLLAVKLPGVCVDAFIVPTEMPNIKLIPSSASTKQVGELLRMHSKSYNAPAYEFLDEALGKIEADFDIIVIDTPPGQDEPVQAALFASTDIIIPTFAEQSYVDGITETYRLVKELEKNSGVQLNITGILFTRVEKNVNAYNKFVAAMQDSLYAKILIKTPVRKAQIVPDSMTDNRILVEYQPRSNPAQDYGEVYREIKERMGMK